MPEKKIADRSKEKLVSFVSAEVTNMFGNILDFTELAVGDSTRYRILRSKVLKISNDTIRNITKEIEDRYSVEYESPIKDILVINNKIKWVSDDTF